MAAAADRLGRCSAISSAIIIAVIIVVVVDERIVISIAIFII
jgi:hypothetical protein